MRETKTPHPSSPTMTVLPLGQSPNVPARGPLWRNMRSLGLVTRELIGWCLLVGGLVVFRISLGYLSAGQIVESMITTVMGVFLFRGGLQLVKVSVAARALGQPRQYDNFSNGHSGGYPSRS